MQLTYTEQYLWTESACGCRCYFRTFALGEQKHSPLWDPCSHSRSNAQAQRLGSTATVKPSSGSSIGVTAKSFQLIMRWRYITNSLSSPLPFPLLVYTYTGREELLTFHFSLAFSSFLSSYLLISFTPVFPCFTSFYTSYSCSSSFLLSHPLLFQILLLLLMFLFLFFFLPFPLRGHAVA